MLRPDSRKQTDGRHILVTAVHYNDQPVVAAFLEHLRALALPEGWRLHVAIADNSGTWDASQPLPPGVAIFAPEENVGYLRGCAFALDRWREDHAVLPDWVAVANTDLKLSQGFFRTLLEFDPPEGVGVLGPAVRLPDGTAQNPFKRARPSRARMYAYSRIFRSRFLARLLEIAHRTKAAIRSRLRATRNGPNSVETGDPIVDVYAVHGSAIFLRDTFFVRGGALNYRGFMYGEEIFIAEQARKIGVRVAWMPGLQFLHQAHTTTGAIADRRRTAWQHESARIAWEDHFSRRSVRE